MRLQNSLTQSQEGYLGEQGIWRVEQRGEGTPHGDHKGKGGERAAQERVRELIGMNSASSFFSASSSTDGETEAQREAAPCSFIQPSICSFV